MKNLILIFATGVIISTITSLTATSDLDLFYEHIEMVEASKMIEEEILEYELNLDDKIVFEEQDENHITIDLSEELSKEISLLKEK